MYFSILHDFFMNVFYFYIVFQFFSLFCFSSSELKCLFLQDIRTIPQMRIIPPPAPSTVVSTTNLSRTYSVPLNTSAPSSVVAPGPSSAAQTIIPQDPKDPLGLNNLPPAGSYLPGIGFVPQINQPPKMTARLQESAASA